MVPWIKLICLAFVLRNKGAQGDLITFVRCASSASQEAASF